MESFITSFDLDYPVFRDLLKSIRAYIAGSSVLAGVLKAADKPSFEPGDMDIWVGYCTYSIGYSVEYIIGKHLLNNGYSQTALCERDKRYYESLSQIMEVMSFANAAGKKIQLIRIDFDYKDMNTDTIERYISKHFDLTCCMAYWDPHTEKCKHLHESATLNGKMTFCLNTPTAQQEERIKKYESRGFTLVNPIVNSPTIAADSEWHKVDCIDIMTFDEYPVAEYLAKSGTIVIKSGEQYYGFSRRLFKESTKYVNHNGYVRKTPLGHIISTIDMRMIDNKEAFIFEAVPLVDYNPPFTNYLKVLLGPKPTKVKSIKPQPKWTIIN